MKFRLNKGTPLGDIFFQRDGVVYGPYRAEDILELISPETPVFREGQSWLMAKDSPYLSSFFHSSTPRVGGKKLQKTNQPENKEPAKADRVTDTPQTLPGPPEERKKSWLLPLVLIGVISVLAFVYLNNMTSSSGATSTPADSSVAVRVDSSFLDNTLDIYKTLSGSYINDVQLSRLTYADVLNYQNELLARHGYIFEDKAALDYYRSKDWYKPVNDFLMATASFTPVEKANFELLERKNIETKTGFTDLATRYFRSFTEGNFDANEFFSDRVTRYISKFNLTPNQINELSTQSAAEFVRPSFRLADPLELRYQRGDDGIDYYYFRIFYTVFRTSKNKYQSCYINFKWGLNGNRKITHYEEVKLDDLKFTDAEPVEEEVAAGSSDTWMVILGSFAEESEAIRARDSYSDKLSDLEVLDTNAYTNLEKDLHIVCAGRGLTREDALSLAGKLKALGLSPYVKDAGPLQ